MPANEKEKKEIEKIREEADRVAQEQAISSFVIEPEKGAEEYNTGHLEVMPDAEIPSHFVDVESVAKTDEAEGSLEPGEVKGSYEEQRIEPTTEEEYVAEVANTNFQKFLAQEGAEVNKAVESIKQAHQENYDNYVAALKNSKYYEQCLAKWEKYYANKKAQYESEAREDAKAIDVLTKSVVANSQTRETKMNQQSNFVEEPQTFVQPKAKVSTVVTKPEDEMYKVKVSDLKLDPDLHQTVEQMLLRDLRTAIDEYRDYYEKEMDKISETSKSKISIALRETTGVRSGLLTSLVNSFDEIFKITDGKSVYQFYLSDSKKMQSRVAAKKDNKDIKAVAESIMCSLYRYDETTKQNVGIIADMAKFLTAKLQEEMIKKGKLGNFNLYKNNVKNLAGEIIKKYKITSNIIIDNKANEFVGFQFAKLEELYLKAAKDIKTGSFTVSKEEIDEIIHDLQFVDFISNKNDVELAYFVDEQAQKLEEIINGRQTVEQKELLKMLEVQRKLLAEKRDFNQRVNKNAHEFYKTNSAVQTSTRVLVDKLLMNITEKVGAENSKGKLKQFDISQEEQHSQVKNLIKFVDENRDNEISISEDLLNEIVVEKHDLREKYENSHAKLSNEAQSDADLIGKLLDSGEKDVAKFINSNIEESIKNRPAGKRRPKHVVVEEEGSYIK